MKTVGGDAVCNYTGFHPALREIARIAHRLQNFARIFRNMRVATKFDIYHMKYVNEHYSL